MTASKLLKDDRIHKFLHNGSIYYCRKVDDKILLKSKDRLKFTEFPHDDERLVGVIPVAASQLMKVMDHERMYFQSLYNYESREA